MPTIRARLAHPDGAVTYLVGPKAPKDAPTLRKRIAGSPYAACDVVYIAAPGSPFHTEGPCSQYLAQLGPHAWTPLQDATKAELEALRRMGCTLPKARAPYRGRPCCGLWFDGPAARQAHTQLHIQRPHYAQGGRPSPYMVGVSKAPMPWPHPADRVSRKAFVAIACQALALHPHAGAYAVQEAHRADMARTLRAERAINRATYWRAAACLGVRAGGETQAERHKALAKAMWNMGFPFPSWGRPLACFLAGPFSLALTCQKAPHGPWAMWGVWALPLDPTGAALYWKASPASMQHARALSAFHPTLWGALQAVKRIQRAQAELGAPL